jgi:hypothetical protein
MSKITITIPIPPEPPKPKLWCDACGDITITGHTSLICRFLNWIGRRTNE